MSARASWARAASLVLAEDWSIALVLSAWVCLLFGASLTYSWTNWDDYEFIISRPLVHEPLAGGLGELLRTRRLGYPAPVTTLSAALNWRLGDGTAWPFHLTNLVLHSCNGWLVFKLLRRTSVNRLLATWGAALFLAHPIVVEPVCWATGQKDLLATFFSLAALLVFMGGAGFVRPSQHRIRPWARAGAVVGLAALALFSKPSSASLPGLMGLAWWWTTPPGARRRWSAWQSLSVGAPLLLVAVAVHWSIEDSQGIGAIIAAPLAERISYAVQAFTLGLRNLVWPTQLSAIYFEALPNPWPGRWALAFSVALPLWMGACVWAWRNARGVLLGLAWIALSYLPVSGLVHLVRGPADSYMYLPWIGMVIALTQLIRACQVRSERRRGRLARSGAVSTWWLLPILVCAMLSVNQARAWSSSSALWMRVVSVYPVSASAHQNLGDALLLEGDTARAVLHLERAVNLDNRDADFEARMALAEACAALARERCSFEQLQRLFERHPDNLLVALSIVGASQLLSSPEHRHLIARGIARARAGLSALDIFSETELRKFGDVSGHGLASGGLSYFADEPALEATVRRLEKAFLDKHAGPHRARRTAP